MVPFPNTIIIFLSSFSIIGSIDLLLQSPEISNPRPPSSTFIIDSFAGVWKENVWKNHIYPFTVSLANVSIQSLLIETFAVPRLNTEYTILNTLVAFYMYFLFQDFYFYIAHRLMHHPAIYKYTHKLHHEYKHPNICCSYYENPIEHIIVWTTPYIILPHIIPIHQYAFWTFVFATTAFSILGHNGKNYQEYIWYAGYIWTPATLNNYHQVCHAYHHDLHHVTTQYNYALYFTYWDRVFNTLHPTYDDYCHNLFYLRPQPQPQPRLRPLALINQ